jgi:release factor glutamine methyltransferase
LFFLLSFGLKPEKNPEKVSINYRQVYSRIRIPPKPLRYFMRRNRQVNNPFLPIPANLSAMPFDHSQVYQPEADTFLLLRAALEEIKPGDRVLEVGTGSGTVAAGLTGLPGTRVVATDINPHAVLCARNAGVDVLRTDLFAALRGIFDLILFNPPYLPTLAEERIDDWLEYALDGGESGRVVIEQFAAGVGRVLAPGGRILLLVSSLTGPEDVKELFSRYGFSIETARQEIVEDEELFVLRIVRRGNRGR